MMRATKASKVSAGGPISTSLTQQQRSSLSDWRSWCCGATKNAKQALLPKSAANHSQNHRQTLMDYGRRCRSIAAHFIRGDAMKHPEILAKLSLEQNVPCSRVEINSI